MFGVTTTKQTTDDDDDWQSLLFQWLLQRACSSVYETIHWVDTFAHSSLLTVEHFFFFTHSRRQKRTVLFIHIGIIGIVTLGAKAPTHLTMPGLALVRLVWLCVWSWRRRRLHSPDCALTGLFTNECESLLFCVCSCYFAIFFYEPRFDFDAWRHSVVVDVTATTLSVCGSCRRHESA